MMLKIISDPSKLQKYQDQLMKQLAIARTNIIHCRISFRPAYIDAEVNWSSNLNLWWYSRLVPENKLQWSKQNRWWNAFGIEQPMSYQTLHIACEINIPTEGINRGIAAAIAEDENGRVFVIHRGNHWGGGKKGITKAFFWENYKNYSRPWEPAHDGERVTEVAVITELGNPNLPSDIANFIHWVSKIKASVKRGVQEG